MKRRLGICAAIITLGIAITAAATAEESASDEIALQSGDVRRMLGRGRAALEARLGRQGRPDRDGWLRFGSNLLILIENGRCMRIRVALPSGLSCQDAAAWAGWPTPTGSAPLRRHQACEWPGLSVRHRLAAGVAARLDLANSVLEVWIAN